MKKPCRGIPEAVFCRLIALAFLLQACAADKGTPSSPVPVQTIERPNTMWGLPFDFRPVGQAEASLQDAAKAVAYVRFAEGATATGFFISEDGLFLTNEHVISRDSCLKSRCAGIQIIRDFRPGGALELFEEFEVLAESKEIDVSLLRVKLPPGKKVPFLKLGEKKDYTGSDPLFLVGHPAGASLHVSSSRLDKSSDPAQAYFRSVSVGGNSGSPIVDAKTMEVVAIHSGSSRRDRRIDRSGAVYGYGTGILVGSIEKMLKTLDPAFSLKDPRFSASAAVSQNLKQQLIGPPQEGSGPMTLDLFARTAIGTEREKSSLGDLFRVYSGKTFEAEQLASLLDSLIAIDLNRGKILPLASAELKAFLPEGWDWPASAKTFYFGGSREDCLKNLLQYTPRSQFTYSAVDCTSPILEDGQSAFVLLQQIFEAEKGRTWGADHETFDLLILSGIETHLLLRHQLSAEDTALLKEVLAKIGNEATLMALYFRADQDLTLLTEKPALLEGASFSGI